jgi:hypothetical protein
MIARRLIDFLLFISAIFMSLIYFFISIKATHPTITINMLFCLTTILALLYKAIYHSARINNCGGHINKTCLSVVIISSCLFLFEGYHYMINVFIVDHMINFVPAVVFYLVSTIVITVDPQEFDLKRLW